MDNITYLAELAEGLARWVPKRERQDILRYYAEYFEEAGPEREAEVVAELGDPWALSSRLAVEGGFVTWEKASAWSPKKRWPKVLIGTAVGLSIFALVCGLGLLAFNVTGAVSSFVDPVAELEQVTVVDWGMAPVWGDEFGIGYAYTMERDPGVYFLAGENVTAFSSIDADLALGNIEVVAGDSFSLSVSRSEAMSGYEPTWEISNGVLRIRDNSRMQWSLKGSWGVAVTVTVPENVVLNKIRVKTGLGDVLLYGLNAETVTAETGLGDVECYEVRNVRKLDLNTGMGDVNLGLEEARSGLDIHLESGMGNIEATLCGAETDYSYTLESGMGHVTVNGASRGSEAERRNSAPYRLNAESGMGDVSVYFTYA